MPINTAVFKQRATTAALFAAAMIGGVFGGRVPFQVLFSIVGIGCMWELFGLSMPGEARLKRAFYSFLALYPWWFITLWGLSNLWWLSIMCFPLLVGAVFLMELFDRKSAAPFQNAGQFCLGMFYIAMPLMLLKLLCINLETGAEPRWAEQIYAPKKVLGLLLLTWSNDTFAYLVGSFIGKNPLFERISPKKTWEGTIGGGLLTIGLGWVLFQFLGEWTLAQWLAIAATIALFGTLGDLVESMFKRSIGVKDSGNLLPGHGGMLDRFDAFIFMLPWVWLVLQVMK